MNNILPSKKFVFYLILALFSFGSLAKAQSSEESVYFKRFVNKENGDSDNNTPPQATFAAFLNHNQSKILLENAPRWDGGDTNIEGNGTFGVELANFPGLSAGDTATVRFTDNAIQQQGMLSVVIDTIPWTDNDPFTRMQLASVNLPAKPQNVQISVSDTGENTISWDLVSGVQFVVYRRTLQDTIFSGESRYLYTKVADSLTTSTYTDTTVQTNKNFAYVVFARNSEGVMSSHSAEVHKTGKIQNLTVTATATNAHLNWNDYNTEIGQTAGYNIYRRKEGTTYGEPIAYTDTVSSYIDTKLEMGTKYYYKVQARNTNLKNFGMSDEVAVTTQNSQDGYYTYASLNVAVVVYLNTNQGTIPESKIEDFKRQLKLSKEFYWRNSGMKFNVNFKWYPVYENQNISSDNEFALKNTSDILKSRGVMNTQYDLIFRIWPVENGYWSIGATDGLSLPGPDHRTGFSQVQYPCGTGVVYPGKPDMNYCYTWVFIHEAQHAIDDIYRRNGHPEMAHGDHPEVFEVPKGNHLDFQAKVFRTFKGYEDLTNGWGDIYEVKDADNDQFPDDDPTVAFDEKRFGSDPGKVDTDGDGLSDRLEATNGTFTGSDPKNPDTDNDGIPDGQDAHPRYAVRNAIKRVPQDMTPVIDGNLNEWIHKALVDSGVVYVENGNSYNPKVYMTYDADKLYLGMELQNIGIPTFHFDFEGDGRWHGAGNTEIGVNVSKSTFSEFRSWDSRQDVRDFSDPNPDDNFPGPGMWDTNPDYQQEFQRRVISPNRVKLSVKLDLPKITLEMAIPRTSDAGLTLNAGDTLAMNINYGKVNNIPGNWASTFDQYSYVNFVLSDDLVTAIEQNDQIAQQFELKQNYPNPFNPTTNIRYSVPKAEKVSIKVFDMLGRNVATLVNDVKSAGAHTVTFDASHLSSGVYLYRLQTPDHVQTRKMLLIK